MVMTTAASGAKQLENDDDAAGDDDGGNTWRWTCEGDGSDGDKTFFSTEAQDVVNRSEQPRAPSLAAIVRCGRRSWHTASAWFRWP